jgi:hypothetical protein
LCRGFAKVPWRKPPRQPNSPHKCAETPVGPGLRLHPCINETRLALPRDNKEATAHRAALKLTDDLPGSGRVSIRRMGRINKYRAQ